jgi:hypothetical protein
MIKTPIVLLLLGLTFACRAQVPPAPQAATPVQDSRWPIPTGWNHETFPLPPSFAPDLSYKGSEDLRFMPGWSSPDAPDYW